MNYNLSHCFLFPTTTPAPQADPKNFQKDDLIEVGDGIKVGEFLMNKTILKAKEEQIKQKANQMNEYVNQMANEIKGQAVDHINVSNEKNLSILSEKDSKIENLEKQLGTHEEAFINFKNESLENSENLKKTFQEKVANLENILESRGSQAKETYESYYGKAGDIFPIKKFSPVCQEVKVCQESLLLF